MNFHSSEPLPSFLSAPLLNLIFLILLFFAVAYAFNREEKLLRLNLPTAPNATISETAFPHTQQPQLIINVDAAGEIFVAGNLFTLAALERRLAQLTAFAPSPPIIIRADADVLHRHLIKVLNVCTRAGIEHVGISVIATE